MTENSCRENMHALPWWQPLTHEEAERFFGLGTPRRRSSYRADLPARMTSSWRLRSTRFSTARPRARAGNATSLIGVPGALAYNCGDRGVRYCIAGILPGVWYLRTRT